MVLSVIIHKNSFSTIQQAQLTQLLYIIENCPNTIVILNHYQLFDMVGIKHHPHRLCRGRLIHHSRQHRCYGAKLQHHQWNLTCVNTVPYSLTLKSQSCNQQITANISQKHLSMRAYYFLCNIQFDHGNWKVTCSYQKLFVKIK